MISITLRKIIIRVVLAVFFTFSAPFLTYAYDITDKFSLEGKLTGLYQYGDWNAENADNAGRGAAVLDLGANFQFPSH
jgi:hypothetical protein